MKKIYLIIIDNKLPEKAFDYIKDARAEHRRICAEHKAKLKPTSTRLTTNTKPQDLEGFEELTVITSDTAQVKIGLTCLPCL